MTQLFDDLEDMQKRGLVPDLANDNFLLCKDGLYIVDYTIAKGRSVQDTIEHCLRYLLKQFNSSQYKQAGPDAIPLEQRKELQMICKEYTRRYGEGRFTKVLDWALVKMPFADAIDGFSSSLKYRE